MRVFRLILAWVKDFFTDSKFEALSVRVTALERENLRLSVEISKVANLVGQKPEPKEPKQEIFRARTASEFREFVEREDFEDATR